MKRYYESPLATEVKIEVGQMLAASFEVSDDRVDTSNGGQLSNDRRGEWGNLWK